MNNLLSLDQRLDRIEQLLIGQQQVMSLDQACTYCSISKSYMYKLTSAQKIPHFKPQNKAIYFKKAELDEFLLQNRIQTTDEIEEQASNYLLRNRK